VNQLVSHTDSYRQLLIFIPIAAVSGRKPTSVRSSPAVTVNHDQVVVHLSRREHSPSNNTKGDIGHKQFIFKEHLQEVTKSKQASKSLRKTGDFIRKSSYPDKKTSFLKSNNPARMAENEQLSSNSKNSRINRGIFAVKTHFQRAISSRQVGSISSCCLGHLLKGEYPIFEEESAEQPVENLRLLQEIASACSCNDGCDEHSGINYRNPPGLLPTNQVHSGDLWWT
jgi:hypothetical protein